MRGRFAKLTARVEFDPDARSGSVVVDVDTASVDTGNATLDGILRSAQFLEADTYPDARFLSERLVFAGDTLAAVEGTLWLHGVQRPVTLTADRLRLQGGRLRTRPRAPSAGAHSMSCSGARNSG